MPRKRRRKRLRSKSAPPVLQTAFTCKRKQWSEESILAALESVRNGKSIQRSALQHGVPRTTLQDRHLGKVVHGSKPGPVPYLNIEEEKQLSEFLQVVSQIGYGKTRQQVKSIAETVAVEKGVLKGNQISDGWFRRYLERSPNICLRKGDSTANCRMNAMSNNEALDNYFRLLKKVLEENDLISNPSQIYNVDESGMPLEQSSHVFTSYTSSPRRS